MTQATIPAWQKYSTISFRQFFASEDLTNIPVPTTIYQGTTDDKLTADYERTNLQEAMMSPRLLKNISMHEIAHPLPFLLSHQLYISFSISFCCLLQ